MTATPSSALSAKEALTRATADARKARFADAASILDESALRHAPSARAVLLRARIYLKRDAGAALTYLARSASRTRAGDAAGVAAILAGVAHARLGDARSARACFRDAKALLGSQSPARAELAYQQAVALWIERRLNAAEAALEHASPPEAGSDLDVEIRVLRGAIAASRGAVAAQGAILIDALPLVAHDDASVLHRGIVVAQIASLGCELPSAALRDAARREVPRVPWTHDIADVWFDALRELAWSHALEGDYFNAFRRLKEAAAVAPSDAWRVVALCDRASVAAAIGERRWSEQELRDALDLADRVVWDSVRGEERFALAAIAELLAPRDPALALAWVSRWRDLSDRWTRTLASSNDRRVIALDAFASATVRAVLGEAAEAERLYRQAWDIYEAIGYDWRAGRTALRLAKLTGDDKWHELALMKLRAYPHARWLAAPITTEEEPAQPPQSIDPETFARLTPAQRGVVALVVRGLRTDAIARELGRSEHTVRNHLKTIFRTLGVRTRAALVARVAGTD